MRSVGERLSRLLCRRKNGKVDYDRVRENEFYRRGIDRLRRAQAGGMRVALSCANDTLRSQITTALG
jgi:hypothetical protein